MTIRHINVTGLGVELVMEDGRVYVLTDEDQGRLLDTLLPPGVDQLALREAFGGGVEVRT
ncbi:MAG: hypothetical protein ACTHYO_10395 [Micrococcaceae bacterium]